MICQCTPSSFSKRLLALAIEAEEQGREWEKPCDHEPSEPIAAFWFTCKHCGEGIEWMENARKTMEFAYPFLLIGDKEMYLEFCKKLVEKYGSKK